MEKLNMSEKNKIAIVTGGSKGIGKAIVEELINKRYFVYFTYNKSVTEAKEIEERLGKENCKSLFCPVENYDISNQIYQEEFKEKEISLLVNNAGVTDDILFAMMEIENFENVVLTNLFGSIYLTRLLIRSMIGNKKGVIVNISSVAGVMGSEGQTNYSASKGAIDAFTRSLAKEVGKYNIRVVGVAPGFTKTSMYSKVPMKYRRKQLEAVALKRVAEPQEIASVVSFLASERASYITGTTIRVDGGMS
jgi:3-oxoacyl-[acyl-carrier protein] reductase